MAIAADLHAAALPAEQHAAAVGVLARGMADNPLHVAAFGDDPARRETQLRRMFTALFRHASPNDAVGVWRDGVLVAVTGALSEHACRPSTTDSLRMLPVVARMGLRTASRVGAWVKTWREHDPDEPHVHLGPLAVDGHLQGQGIGSVLLAEHCRRLDAAGALGYLETDRAANVAFYERQGYAVVTEGDVIGVRCWYMRREPRA